MANKIEQAADAAYFEKKEHNERTGLDFYKNGYIDGYLAAIEKIIGCMGESCNKLRLESIDKVINEKNKSHETDSKK